MHGFCRIRLDVLRIVVVVDFIYMNQTPSINIHLYTTQYTQTAELVNVALNVALGCTLYITIFAI
jgi:hypothetical protein